MAPTERTAGDPVGVIPGARGGQTFVDPDSDILDRATSSPGWTAVDEVRRRSEA